VNTCKKLFFLAVLFAMALLPLASDSEAQQSGFCPRNANFYTITKQQTTTSYYTQIQQSQQTQAYLQQQQQASMMASVQRSQSATNRSTTQVNSTPMTSLQTSTQMQQHQQTINKVNTNFNVTQQVCAKTTPQLMTTGTGIAHTNTALQTSTTASQCTYVQQQHTQQAIAKTNTAIQHTNAVSKQSVANIQKTNTAINKTTTAIQQTITPIQKTTTDLTVTGLEKVTTTKTMTTKVYFDVNCMQCHHPDQPTGTQVAHKMPIPVHQPGHIPQMVPKAGPFPVALQPRMPLLPPMVANPGMWPQMAARQPWPVHQGMLVLQQPQRLAIDTARVTPLVMATPTPTLKLVDLPAFLRTPDSQSTKTKLDPLVMTASAKTLPAVEKLPLIVDVSAGPATRGTARALDMFDAMVPEEGQGRGPQEFVLPLSEEELLQPPVRVLPAAVIQLPAPAPLAPGQLDEEELLPPVPTVVEPSKKRDPFDIFGAPTVLTPVAAPRPNPAPALIQPGLPTNRNTDPLPG
jgi:hypothetical protein